MATKATVKLGGVSLAANVPITWRLQTGTTPYQTPMQVHKSQWDRLKGQIAKPLTLEVVDSDGTKQTARELYILHRLPSDSPNRVTFLVSDRRWKWSRVLVARDYNVPRRTGDRTIVNPKVPVGTEVIVDKYDFKTFSLKNGEHKWTAREAVEDVLRVITESETNKWFVESFPIGTASGEDSFSMQGVLLRDAGDVALARILSYVPGTAVYIDVGGLVRVIDAASLRDGEKHFETLPPETWSGDAPSVVKRDGIRPGRVLVHYQREVELLTEFEDDWSGATSTPADKRAPFLQNVIPTVDPTTSMEVYDPDTGENKTVDVPAGTYVEVHAWLDAMDKLKPTGSFPWTFDVVKRHWFTGTLEVLWGGGVSRGIPDDVADGNVMSRIQTFKSHFRRTFRINPRYMDRIRSVSEVRVAPQDPVTGARTPAMVWGQSTIIPSQKGYLVGRRRPDKSGEWILTDNFPAEGSNTTDGNPSAARVSFLDRDQGIFRVEWVLDPAGTEGSVVPCHTAQLDGKTPMVVSRRLADQDIRTSAMGAAMRREAGTNEVVLADVMKLNMICTIVPGAPNNKQQFHVEVVSAKDVEKLLAKNTSWRIQGGTGPDIEVFIPPSEVTARFAWQDDDLAKLTMRIMLGLDFDDPTSAGLPKGTRELSGFNWQNPQREVPPHARSVALEMLAPFADNLMGRVATRLPKETMRLKGNISGASVRVAGAPSAKVDALHEFPGVQRAPVRFATLPDSTRRLVLGIIGGVLPDE